MLNINPFYGNACIDGNILNGYMRGDKDCREIMAMKDSGDISFVLPYSLSFEIGHANTPHAIRSIGNDFITTDEDALDCVTLKEFHAFFEIKGKLKK